MKDSKKPKKPKKSKLNLIPIELAQDMVNAYRKQRCVPAARKRSKQLGKKVEEPYVCWVSKEALLELMKSNKADGIRFYYGIEDDYPDYPLKKPEYKGAHTLVMVATRSEDPANPTMENSVDCLNIPEKTVAKIRKSGKTDSVLLSKASFRSGSGSPANDVDMCPPPTPPKGQRL